MAANLSKLKIKLKSAEEIEEFTEEIISTMREPVLVLEKELRVIKASPAFYDCFKASPEETIGAHIYELNSGQWNIPKMRELLETILPEKATLDNYEVEHDFTAIGKRILLLNARKIQIESEKEQIILLAIEDVTKHKRFEDDIQLRNEQLMALNSEKDKFFSIIAHDLKSPFQGFLGLTKMMSEEANIFSAEELSKVSGDMYKTVQNLFTLLKNLLEWAQMQKGSMDFQPEELSLSHLIEENVKTMKERGRQKGITLINMVRDPFYAYADQNMLNSVISNLLSNAIKFTNRDGSVTINAKKNDNEMIEITVTDTGVGISRESSAKLFKLGGKMRTRGTEEEPGTGLGLLLCREFVGKHGGEIWVESEEGIGSKFYFTLRSGIR